MTYLSLELLGCLSNETGVEDQSVFGGIVLGLESPEKSLLSSENLNSTGRVFGEVQ